MTRDPIFHLQKGSGPRQFVLLHNAGGSHQFLQKMFHFLSKKGLALNLDLPGHGKSAPMENYSVEAYAQKVQELLSEKGRGKWGVIGLNYGANIAMEIYFQSPHLISHLVLIDPPIFIQPEARDAIEKHIEELRALSPSAYAQNFIDQIFVHAVPSIKRIALKAFANISREVLISTYSQLFIWDRKAQEKLKSIAVPALQIQTSQPFCENLQEFIRHLKVGRVVGSGFWATLEVPNQVHAMIDRFLELQNS